VPLPAAQSDGPAHVGRKKPPPQGYRRWSEVDSNPQLVDAMRGRVLQHDLALDQEDVSVWISRIVSRASG
jgi:hypothetical protein